MFLYPYIINSREKAVSMINS